MAHASTQSAGQHVNRLCNEKSPYLLQHAHNPVDWYPWGEEAFKIAKQQDKPVFLSVGYSTCHWCHVMAHESFEDEEVAKLMNEVFINIKVDREERPDVDSLYMSVCVAMNGSGGWPLTVMLTADKRPFFAGTYFPKTARKGATGLVELINRVKELWNNNRVQLEENASQIVEVLVQAEETFSKRGSLSDDTLSSAFTQLVKKYDTDFGGFGFAPKFPTPHMLTLCMRCFFRYKDNKGVEMVEGTLNHIRNGGIYDHIGYGFHRYATDRKWIVPHFEKMLYDQALLIIAFSEAYQITKKIEYANTIKEVITYLLRDLISPEGAFFSAEDADTEGVEGKFYIWTASELKELLGSDAQVFMKAFNCSEVGNWENGANILFTDSTEHLQHVSKEYSLDVETLLTRLNNCRQVLFQKRAKRVRPHRDEKVLTDWNGLLIGALAKASRALHDSSYASIACKAAAFFLSSKMYRGGKLFHRYKDGDAAVPGMLDDYSFLSWGLSELYMATFNDELLFASRDICREMIRLFADSNGGFFLTPSDQEVLIVRKKEAQDGAVPSGNSIAMLALLNLADITGDEEMEKKALELATSLGGSVGEAPTGHCQFLVGVDSIIGPRSKMVIAAKSRLEALEFASTINEHYLPRNVLIYNSGAGFLPESSLATTTQEDGKPRVYTCIGTTCKPPASNPADALKLIL